MTTPLDPVIAQIIPMRHCAIPTTRRRARDISALATPRAPPYRRLRS
jgi:hypothetical protein